MGFFLSIVFEGLVEAVWNSEWKIFEDWPKLCSKECGDYIVMSKSTGKG